MRAAALAHHDTDGVDAQLEQVFLVRPGVKSGTGFSAKVSSSGQTQSGFPWMRAITIFLSAHHDTDGVDATLEQILLVRPGVKAGFS